MCPNCDKKRDALKQATEKYLKLAEDERVRTISLLEKINTSPQDMCKNATEAELKKQLKLVKLKQDLAAAKKKLQQWRKMPHHRGMLHVTKEVKIIQ